MLYVYGGIYGPLGWARITRRGFVTTERMNLESRVRLGGDRHGRLYFLDHGLLAVMDGTMQPVWKLSASAGPAGLRDERHLAVSPNGEATVVGDGGRLRRVGPAGAVLFASEASRRADQAGSQCGWA